MARTAAKPDETAAVDNTDQLDIQESDWQTAGVALNLHPQITEKVKYSWDNRVEKGNTVKTPRFQLAVKTLDEAKLRVRQIRDAGTSLGVGTSIKPSQLPNPFPAEGVVLHFRATRRRGTGKSE